MHREQVGRKPLGQGRLLLCLNPGSWRQVGARALQAEGHSGPEAGAGFLSPASSIAWLMGAVGQTAGVSSPHLARPYCSPDCPTATTFPKPSMSLNV